MDTANSLADLSKWKDKAAKKRGAKINDSDKVEELLSTGKQILSVKWDEVYSVAQVRKRFRRIEELAESLRLHGQDHPIRVFPKDDTGYKIRKGERRWRAAKHNDGYIDIIIDDSDPNDEIKETIGQIVENFQRDDLTPLELANAFGALRDKGVKQKEIGKQVGLTESSVSKYLSLLNTPDEITELLEAEVTSDLELIGTLRKIHEIDEERCKQLCAAALADGITRPYAQGILRGLKQEQSDVARKDANPKSSNPQLDDPGKLSDQEHEKELNEAGLNEPGIDLPAEPNPEPKKTPAKTPEPRDPHSQRESALRNDDGFYERRAEDAVLLCEVEIDGKKKKGVIQLHLLGEEDDEIVLRMSGDNGEDTLVAVKASQISLIGYRQ